MMCRTKGNRWLHNHIRDHRGNIKWETFYFTDSEANTQRRQTFEILIDHKQPTYVKESGLLPIHAMVLAPSVRRSNK